MKEIGVFICNYNKADFVVKCVQALKDQTYKELDIYVVDNASEDDSVKKLRDTYQDEITILQNAENLGGAGGFGRGIREALYKGYRYFMLVDNDAFLDKKAVEYLHDYMEAHEDVGICGAETLNLQQPDKIQDLGGRLDMEEYQWHGIIGGLQDLEGGAVLECDYVASCSVMARTEAVRKFGGFPEENFIYWDDVEWCTKCWRAGYKVIVNGNAKAYHDLSGANVRNMFFRYYAARNRYRYFAKYLPEEKLEDFYQVITREFFLRNYGAVNKKKYGTFLTEWNALDDFLHGITGKAAPGRIVPYEKGIDRLAARVKEADSVLVYMPEHTKEAYGWLNKLLRYFTKHHRDIRVNVTFDPEKCRMAEDGTDKNDMIVQLCEHATMIDENILPRIYVDSKYNCILDEQDYRYFSSYEQALKSFQDLYRPLFQERIEQLRSGS